MGNTIEGSKVLLSTTSIENQGNSKNKKKVGQKKSVKTVILLDLWGHRKKTWGTISIDLIFAND